MHARMVGKAMDKKHGSEESHSRAPTLIKPYVILGIRGEDSTIIATGCFEIHGATIRWRGTVIVSKSCVD